MQRFLAPLQKTGSRHTLQQELQVLVVHRQSQELVGEHWLTADQPWRDPAPAVAAPPP